MQFDNKRTLEDYGCNELAYYRDHLKDFFRYYTEFPFERQIVDCYSGKRVNKEDYQYNIDVNHPVTIAAPLLRRVNCTKYLSNLDLMNFQESCSFSYKYLEEYRATKTEFDIDLYYPTDKKKKTPSAYNPLVV